MIDRAARNRLAFGLRQLAVGITTNDEFDDAVFDNCLGASDDPAVEDLATFGWLHYDDFSTYRLRNAKALTREERRAIARVILFLKSDQMYDFGKSIHDRTCLTRLRRRDWLGLSVIVTALLAGALTWWTVGVIWLGVMALAAPAYLVWLGMMIAKVIRHRFGKRRKQPQPKRHQPVEESFWPFRDELADDEAFRYWPFANAVAYREALAHPPFLCGLRSSE